MRKKRSLSGKFPKGRRVKKSLGEDELFAFVQDRAYRLWDEAGRPHGRDWEFWFRAEKEVKERFKKLGKL